MTQFFYKIESKMNENLLWNFIRANNAAQVKKRYALASSA